MTTVDLFPEVRVDPTEDLDSRFTLPDTDAWCRTKAGVEAWDLDAAACAESHLAPKFYTRAEDGLCQPWSGRVWVNPPFSAIPAWVARAWKSLHMEPVDVVAMLLPGNRCEQPWWQDLVEPYRDRGVLDGGQRGGSGLIVLGGDVELETHWLPGRVKFGHPGNPRGLGVGSPPFGCVMLVWKRGHR